MPRRQQPPEHRRVGPPIWLPLVGWSLTLIGLLIPLVEQRLPRVRLAAFALGLLLVTFHYRHRVFQFCASLHSVLGQVSHWFTLATLGIVLIILYLMKPLTPSPACAVSFDEDQGALFNSWVDAGSAAWINLYGKDDHSWLISKTNSGQNEGRFTYIVNPGFNPRSDSDSSGGYMTFYSAPCDITKYTALTFQSVVTEPDGLSDFGVRLAVDDQNGKERYVYELDSIRNARPNSRAWTGEWDDITLRIDDFKARAIQVPLPPGLNKTIINKIVFFIGAKIGAHSNRATLSFRNVQFNVSDR